MEERRSKVALFQIEQVYFFISRCSKLFASRSTAEARGALDAISNEGTFLLVADTLTDFLVLFPTAEADEDANRQAGLRPGTDHVVGRPKPEAQPATLPKAGPQPPIQSHATTEARRSSGRPF